MLAILFFLAQSKTKTLDGDAVSSSLAGNWRDWPEKFEKKLDLELQ